jgi:hypothetical protein
MTVDAVSINQVFLSNRVLKIPFFQRGYVWGEQNWNKFYEDMTGLVSIPEGETPEVYFLGSIILKEAGVRNDAQQYDVIDGQQRLTTIVMFMKALYLAIDRNDIFRNSFMQMNLTGESRPILTVNYNDQYAYNEIMRLEGLRSDPIIANNRLAEAFAYFAKRIIESANPTDGSDPLPLITLLSRVNNYVRLVSIQVQDGENAQKIFETINCTGIKLTTGEMLKNYLFDEEDKDAYEHTWKPVFECNRDRQNYWEGEMVNGRIKDCHIENFFYRYMLVKMQEPAIRNQLSSSEVKSFRQKDGLFEKFRHLITMCGIQRQDAINDIVAYASQYVDTFKASTLDEALMRFNGVERLACLMFAQDFWTPVPYIMYILKNVHNTRERNAIFGYMETYLMRRIICKSANNNYSDMFSENLIGQQVCTFDAFKNYVNDTENRGATLMPSDDEVFNAVMNNDVKKDARVILYMLESKINTNFETATRDNSYNSFEREQVMPEAVSSNWPLGANYTEEQRENLCKTLGNHILIREKLKRAQKLAGWRSKSQVLKPMCEELELFRFIQNGTLHSWTEENIEQRNRWLADKIINTWAI